MGRRSCCVGCEVAHPCASEAVTATARDDISLFMREPLYICVWGGCPCSKKVARPMPAVEIKDLGRSRGGAALACGAYRAIAPGWCVTSPMLYQSNRFLSEAIGHACI